MARGKGGRFFGFFANPPVSVGFDSPASRFGFGPVLFRLNHHHLLPVTSRAISSPDFRLLLLPYGYLRPLPLLQLGTKFGPGQSTIRRLGPLPLASNLQPGGPMSEPNARARFLYLLPPTARSKNKLLIHVRTPHPERSQASFKFFVHGVRSGWINKRRDLPATS